MIKSNLKWMATALAIIGWLPAQFASANSLINGSFEDPTAGWTQPFNIDGSVNFKRLNSITDKSGVTHLPTDGQWMMGVNISSFNGGRLSQPFIFPASTTTVTFDRNLIDPYFGSSDPLKAAYVGIYLRDQKGRLYESTVPTPLAANSWEPTTLYLSGIPGDKYTLYIDVAANYNGVYCFIAPCPPGDIGTGTFLIDNVVLAQAISPPPTNIAPAAGDIALVINNVGSTTWTPRVNDPNGDQLTCGISILPAPAHGIATVAPDCSSGTYTPNPGYVGSDAFGYIAKDQTLSSNLAIVSVTVGPTASAPTITGFWPGSVKPGSMVFVFGSNFIPRATQVAVNGVSAPIVQVIDDSLLVFMLPPGVTTGPITVTTAAGTATSSSDFGVPLMGLQVTSFWPSEARVYSPVIVFGSGFDPGFGKTKVSINGLAVPIVQVVDPSLLFLLVPPGATSGPITVEVNGQTATSSATLTILP